MFEFYVTVLQYSIFKFTTQHEVGIFEWRALFFREIDFEEAHCSKNIYLSRSMTLSGLFNKCSMSCTKRHTLIRLCNTQTKIEKFKLNPTHVWDITFYCSIFLNICLPKCIKIHKNGPLRTSISVWKKNYFSHLEFIEFYYC